MSGAEEVIKPLTTKNKKGFHFLKTSASILGGD
jgi:hypothetical protein